MGQSDQRDWKSLRPGDRLVEAIIRSGRPSLNAFFEENTEVPWVREIMFSKNRKDLTAAALEIAKASVRTRSFFDLAKQAFLQPDHFIKYDQCTSSEESFLWLLKILDHNKIEFNDFMSKVIRVMDKKEVKFNTLFFIGAPNAGKTLIADSLAKACIFYGVINKFEKFMNFVWAPFLGCRAGLINEPRFTDVYVEELKNVLEGMEIPCDAKWKSDQNLQRLPIIITGNLPLSCYLQAGRDIQEAAFEKRLFKFQFHEFDELRVLKRKLHPGLWYLAICKFLKEIEDDDDFLLFGNRDFIDDYLSAIPPDIDITGDVEKQLQLQGGDYS